MCGIVGIWDRSGAGGPELEAMRRMRDQLRHRGPDDAGEYASGELVLGHRRLSIIDLTTGGQPLGNEDGSVQIVFNGEIYNFQTLRAEAEAAGHRFVTQGDTETIVHLYEELGDDVVRRLEGMFAFALWDGRRRRLLLARDPAGIKPLYYAHVGRRFAFASEIGPLLTLPWVSREIAPASLDRYLERGYVPAPHTMFRDVWKLPAAHRLVIDADGLRVERYWEPRPAVLDAREPQELQEQLFARLDASVRAHLVSDVPLGAFLSGGLDSSIVVGLMRRHCTGALKTFSVGVAAGADYDESAEARLVARHYATDHHEVRLSADDLPDLLRTTAAFMDEPLSEPAAVPTYLLARMARQHVTVALTGEGADETWGGYDVFRKAQAVARYRRVPRWVRRGVTDRVLGVLPGGNRLVTASNNAGYLARLSHLDASARRALYTRDGAALALPELAPAPEEPAALDARDPFTSVFRDLLDTHLAERLLAKVDRMTMASSLEARVPFLTAPFIEFSLGVPASLKLRGQTTKYLLRRAFGRLLPPGTACRRKHAFDLPCSTWLRSSVAPLVHELFAEPLLGDYIDADRQRGMWRRHLTGETTCGTELWALMTLQLWARAFARA